MIFFQYFQTKIFIFFCLMTTQIFLTKLRPMNLTKYIFFQQNDIKLYFSLNLVKNDSTWGLTIAESFLPKIFGHIDKFGNFGHPFFTWGLYPVPIVQYKIVFDSKRLEQDIGSK